MMKMHTRAIEIIEEAFKDKVDKGGAPYMLHLYRVANPFILDYEVYVAALLHDLLEDCEEWTLERLRTIFSERVCNIVDLLTRRKSEDYNDYLNRIKTSETAVEIKLSDLKDNMDLTRIKRRLNENDVKRIVKYHNAYIDLSQFLKEK